jgi:hypothetical protein
MKKGLLLALPIFLLCSIAEMAHARVYVDFSVSSVNYMEPVQDYVVVERQHRVRRPHWRQRHHRHHHSHYYRRNHVYYYPVEYVDDYYYYSPRYVQNYAPRPYYNCPEYDCWGW